jgi:hypothetical protein
MKAHSSFATYSPFNNGIKLAEEIPPFIDMNKNKAVDCSILSEDRL